MASFRRTALAMTILTAAILTATGCRKSGAEDGKAARPAGTGVAQKGHSQAWLGKEPARDSVGRLLLDLDSGDPLRCWRAESALGEMGAAAAPRVRLALAATTPEARAAACRLAYKFRDQAAVPAMIALLGDESQLVRNTANVFLCGLTDQDFDFRPDAMLSDRESAQARWEAWYAKIHGPVLTPKRK